MKLATRYGRPRPVLTGPCTVLPVWSRPPIPSPRGDCQHIQMQNLGIKETEALEEGGFPCSHCSHFLTQALPLSRTFDIGKSPSHRADHNPLPQGRDSNNHSYPKVQYQYNNFRVILGGFFPRVGMSWCNYIGHVLMSLTVFEKLFCDHLRPAGMPVIKKTRDKKCW